jgi:biotin carboxyl carrier protein
MKRYQITIDGQAFDVRLLSDPQQEQVEVEVDGVAFIAQVKALSSVEKAGAEISDHVEPSLPTETPPSVASPGPQTASPLGNAVTAPLPGVIKSVAVQPGQQVSSGDELLVIEAMKMDNIIRASRDGTIETVYVSEGRQVAYGERILQYTKGGKV